MKSTPNAPRGTSASNLLPPGRVTEWLKVPVLKTGVPDRVPRVRIPPLPLSRNRTSPSTRPSGYANPNCDSLSVNRNASLTIEFRATYVCVAARAATDMHLRDDTISTGQSRSFQSRLAQICEGLSFRQVAQLTGTNAETTRRYLKSGRPSIEFVTSLCQAMNVSADWLLCGDQESADRVQVRSLAQVLELLTLATGTNRAAASDKCGWLHVLDGPLAGRAVRASACPEDRVDFWANASTGVALPADRVERMRHPWVLVTYRRQNNALLTESAPMVRITGTGASMMQSPLPGSTVAERARAASV